MKAIIIDDEPKAIQLLKSYLLHFNTIELVQTFRNGLKAFEYLSTEKVDLVFLDINMPHISGINLSRMLPKTTHIIFTTAYSEYAVESYEVHAVDYLLKPISLERFTQSISKVILQAEEKKEAIQSNDIILVKSGIKTHLLKPEDLLFLEKDGNYLTYYTENEKIIARESAGDALKKLPEYFLRTHKSYIVNAKKVTSYDKENIYILQHSIPLGNTYKNQIEEFLKKTD